MDRVDSTEKCRALAEFWRMNIFALQDNGICWGDKLEEATPDRNFNRFGSAHDTEGCMKLLGGPKVNKVYIKPQPIKSVWGLKGCYKETSGRAI